MAKLALSLLTCTLSLIFCSEEEPDYGGILFGGVWRWPVANSSLEHEDVRKAVETALVFLEGRAVFSLRNSDGSFILHTVRDVEKLEIVYSRDDRKPFLMGSVAKDRYGHPVSTFITFGFLYAFCVSIVTKRVAREYNFTVSMFPEGVFHVYSYTSEKLDVLHESQNYTSSYSFSHSKQRDFIKIPSHEDSRKDALISSTSHDKMDSIIWPTRFHTTTLSRGEQFCKSRNIYDQSMSDTCTRESNLSLNFTLMTFNIWNFNTRPEKGDKHYINRIKRLADVIRTYQPDIVALQEVRFQHGKGGNLGPNQIQHLADMLPKYQFVYQPAQLQPNSLKDGRTEEGLAIFSRYPILAHHQLWLFRNQSNSADLHQRLCQHVEIRLSQEQTVHIFNTHLSLSHEAREMSVTQMWDYMNQFKGAAILTGDFNSEPQENSIKYLHERTSLLDVWLYFHGERNLGYTFSTIQKKLTKRIDYLFLRKEKNIQVLDVRLLDDGARGRHAASDHLPLLSMFGFVK